MELEEAIKTRRSVRRFKDMEVPMESVMKAISLACWAPNGGNFQSWKFFVVKNRELIDRMADRLQERMDLMATWPEAAPFSDVFERYRCNSCFFRGAPMVIAFAYGDYQSVSDKVLRARAGIDPIALEMQENRTGVASRIQTVGGVMQTLLLALKEEGLGSCWMVGPMVIRRELEKMLPVPEDMRLFALVPVGYPETAPVAGSRRPLEEVVEILD